jgi:hypothetical protein
MAGAVHSRRGALEEHRHCPEVQRPPPSAAVTAVIPRRSTATTTTPSLRALSGPDRHHDRLHLVVENHVLDDGVLQTKHALP